MALSALSSARAYESAHACGFNSDEALSGRGGDVIS
jgi:hypothetical protein